MEHGRGLPVPSPGSRPCRPPWDPSRVPRDGHSSLDHFQRRGCSPPRSPRPCCVQRPHPSAACCRPAGRDAAANCRRTMQLTCSQAAAICLGQPGLSVLLQGPTRSAAPGTVPLLPRRPPPAPRCCMAPARSRTAPVLPVQCLVGGIAAGRTSRLGRPSLERAAAHGSQGWKDSLSRPSQHQRIS